LAGKEGIEPSSAVLETVILPLNYFPIFGRSGRIRTLIDDFGDRCSAFELHSYILAGKERFELSYTVLETAALPLNYLPIFVFFILCILYYEFCKIKLFLLFF
jgi:hypothetical protein